MFLENVYGKESYLHDVHNPCSSNVKHKTILISHGLKNIYIVSTVCVIMSKNLIF